MSKVVVSNAVLEWAVDRCGRAAELEQRFPRLGEWLRGERWPTLRQLDQLARATSTPLGYFFLSKPPEDQLPIPHFRTLGDQAVRRPSPDLLEVVQTTERRQAWLREYLVERGDEQLSFVRSAKLRDASEHVAAHMGKALGLVQGWAADQPTWTDALRELERRVEEIGISVAVSGIVGNNTRRKLDPAEFRGFVLVDEYAPLVFVNGADFKAAQMFTLAHELAHIWLGTSAAFDLQNLQAASDETEQACNRVAAEFLIPGEELRKQWPRARREPEPFQNIARHFKVSVLVAGRRALDLGLITTTQFLKFYQAYLEDERRKHGRQQDGGNFYATQSARLGRRFAEAVMRATKEGRLLYREAYQLTGLYGRAFERFADLRGFGG